MKESVISPRSAQWREDLRNAMTAKERRAIPRVKMDELDLHTGSHAMRKSTVALQNPRLYLKPHDALTVLIRNASQAVLSV